MENIIDDTIDEGRIELEEYLSLPELL